MTRTSAAILLALCALPGAAHGQRLELRTAVLFERYTFDAGLGFSEVSEATVPVTATLRFGDRADLTLSTGYVRVSVAPTTGADAAETELSGILDTEARLGISVVPGHLMMLLTGTVPTGLGAIAVDDVEALRVLATDVVGFAASSLGAGGSIGGGLVAAIPVGRMALGIAGRYSQPLSYAPVVGLPAELRPGAEIRVRAGLEGALAQRTYVRVTGLFARRARDEFDGVPGSGVGNRVGGYLSLDQGVGGATLTVYGFDLYRSAPRLEQTAIGTAVFPKSNVVGGGAQLAFAPGPRTRITPRAEFRGSWEEVGEDASATLERVGSSLRFGADLRHTLTGSVAFALQAEGVTGNVVRNLEEVGFSGFRFGAFLDITP